MALDELFENAERLKLRFVAGFDNLLRKGLITEAQFQELVDVVDRLDDLSEEELTAKLGEFGDLIRSAAMKQED